MEKFLTDNYSFLTKLVEIIAAVTGIFLYKKYKHTNTKYFIWFLVYVAILELIGGYTNYLNDYEYLHPLRDKLKGTFLEKNNWYYTLFWIIGSALFYSFYYRKVLITSLYKNILKYITSIYLVTSIIFIVLNWEEFCTTKIVFIDISGGIVILLAVVFYCIEMLKSDKILNFYRTLNFYISSTILIWWLIIMPLAFYNIYYSTADWNFVFLKKHIYLFANVFMYLIFSFALIYCKPENE